MFTTAIIAFREFLEAFLIVGVFLGISARLKLKKEKEIILAATLGLVISVLMAIGIYFFGDRARAVLSQKSAEYLEGYLLVFSGLFIAYVIFSLHNTLRHSRGGALIKAHKKLQQNTFDISLFFTIVLLVLREGFEIALFTASTSLFATFIQNCLGLLIGFGGAAILGLTTFFAYTRFSIGKIFKATEYMIILLGASLVQIGVTKLVKIYWNIDLSNMVSIPLRFLPDKESLIGHLVMTLVGVDRNFSMVRLGIMILYVGVVYLLFLKPKKRIIAINKTTTTPANR